MKNYVAEIEDMRIQIRGLSQLRDAQEIGDPHHTHYQGEITALTGKLRRLEESQPLLESADEAIGIAERQYDHAAQSYHHREARYRRGAKRTLVPGLALILTSLAFSIPWWAPAAGCTFVAFSGLLFGLATRTRRDCDYATASLQESIITAQAWRASIDPERPAPAALALVPALDDGHAAG